MQKKGFGALAEEIDALRDEKQRLLLEDANRGVARKRLETLETFLEENDTKITEYDEKMVRLLIEKIMAFEDRLVFTFKSGMEIEVQM